MPAGDNFLKFNFSKSAAAASPAPRRRGLCTGAGGRAGQSPRIFALMRAYA